MISATCMIIEEVLLQRYEVSISERACGLLAISKAHLCLQGGITLSRHEYYYLEACRKVHRKA